MAAQREQARARVLLYGRRKHTSGRNVLLAVLVGAAHGAVSSPRLQTSCVSRRGSHAPRSNPASLAARGGDRLWRLVGVSVPYDEVMGSGLGQGKGGVEPWWKDLRADGVSPALRAAIAAKLGVGVEALQPPDTIRVVRRSLDARRAGRAGLVEGSGGLTGASRGGDAHATGASGPVRPDVRPQYVYVVDLKLPAGLRLRRSPQLTTRAAVPASPPPAPQPLNPPARRREAPESREQARRGDANGAGGPCSSSVVVVGAGPAGLFAALTLADAGVHRVTIVERGQPVEVRGAHIGRLVQRRELNHDSNLCYGEGGAGTWSDGKLTTRIGRNSEAVRLVLQRLVRHGAPSRILVDGKPHLGTDRLVRILRSMREELMAAGATFRWGTRVDRLVIDGGHVVGVRLAGSGEVVMADRVVLAVGHSARELFESLVASGVPLERKPFAVGFRIEHPQSLINMLRLGRFAGEVDAGVLPAADYRLTWQPHTGTALRATVARGGSGGANSQGEGVTANACSDAGAAAGEGPGAEAPGFVSDSERGGAAFGLGGDAFSFCMCPGGQVVPTSTDEQHLCVNGMSFSRRQSRWANAAVVTQVTEEVLRPYVRLHGALAGLAFQEAVEAEAARMGGGALIAPVQRACDFVAGQDTEPSAVPPSSYRLGVRPGRLDLVYPPPLTESLRAALRAWDRDLPGFASHPCALLHGVETRTSCPVRIPRHAATLECTGVQGLFPSGEGAGWAGGIVSAAVDGMRVGRAVAQSVGMPESAMVGLAADHVGDAELPTPGGPRRRPSRRRVAPLEVGGVHIRGEASRQQGGELHVDREASETET